MFNDRITDPARLTLEAGHRLAVELINKLKELQGFSSDREMCHESDRRRKTDKVGG